MKRYDRMTDAEERFKVQESEARVSVEETGLHACWQQHLAGALPVLRLPADYPRSPMQTFTGATHEVTLDATLRFALQHLALTQGVTLFALLLAAYQVLLHRLTGQDDLLVGTALQSGATPDQFADLLILRTTLTTDAAPPFTDFLARVNQTVQGALAHQHDTFSLQVQELFPEGNPEFSPLFQTVFLLSQVSALATRQEYWLPSPALDRTNGHSSGQFDLALRIVDTGEMLVTFFDYNAELFQTPTVEGWACHFETLLRGIVADPSLRIDRLPLLTKAERQRILVAWNDTAADYPHDQCIHHLFEAQVLRTPEAIAVVADGQHLTYQDLNTRANQLAHHLIGLGVGPEVLVAICMERSLDMIVGLLAIFKAGGAYVPLDPTYPAERLAFMLADSQAPVLLTRANLRNILPAHAARVVCLDTDWPTIARQPLSTPANSTQPDNLAYVIYTSGSTGQPKGVLGLHRGAVNRFAWMWRAYPFAMDEVCSQKTSLSFLDSLWEIFGPLLQGIRTVIIPDAVVKVPQHLVQYLADYQITRIVLVPSLLRVLLDTYPDLQERLSRLRYWTTSGEALPLELSQSFRRCMPRAILLNLYGSSEVSADATWYDTGANMTLSSVPIGRPIANTQVYIFDSQMQPVPIGVAGELYIGGIGVARGYLYRPDLTAERFVPNPSGTGQLYRTGDLARYLPDGNIEFLGRADFQVKLRGYRIELGEIEYVLSQHPAVQQAVVVVARSDENDQRLVAYVVGDGVDPATLRAHLAEHLPAYMLPAAFVLLDALPLTPSGKVDRRALPAPDTESVVHTAYVAPYTATEQIITSLWQEVLGLKQVGIHDNFFALGGHSLLAVRMLNAIQQRTGQALPMTALFQQPTVAELAAHLDGTELADDPIVRIRIPEIDHPPRAFSLAHGQQALWFIYQQVPHNAAYNVALTLHLSGNVDVGALGSAFNALVARHPALRTCFAGMDGELLQVVMEPDSVALEMVDGTGWSDAAMHEYLHHCFQHPFDLAQHVCRAMLIKQTSDSYILLLALHHIVADAGSFAILPRDLGVLYASAVSSMPASLPPLPYTYANYMHWEAEMLRLEGSRLRAYWHHDLSGDLPALQLPTDYARPPVQTFNGAVYTYTLDGALTQQLKVLARSHGVTLFTLLLAAYQVLLHRLTGQDDLLVGTAPESGRTRPEFIDVVGYFVNPIVLRSTIGLDAVPGFDTFLARTNQTVQGALAHQHYPFPLLVQELLPTRAPGIAPLIQTMFVLYQGDPDPATHAGMTIAPYRFDETNGQGTGQFDLSLLIFDELASFRIVFDYNTDLFASETIVRWAHHFETLLRGIVDAPARPINRLPLLTETERQRMLVEWNDTARDYPHDQCIHQLFENRVACTPDAVALVFADQQLTYGELNARANQVAHHLRTLGVEPEVPVALCAERSLEMVIGLLGILKAGGAYVPLDPTYPAERLKFILDDTQAPVLLTQEWLHATFPEHTARVVYLDIDQDTIAQQPATTPVVAVTPDNLAYVIYTSGSTGWPKGTLVEHRGIPNLIQATIAMLDLHADDRILQFSSLAFDASTWEIFYTLLAGATLDLGLPDMPRAGHELHALLHSRSITAVMLPPSVLATLPAKPLPFLRTLAVGGEACPWSLAQQWQEGRRLVNAYGPTENTVAATMYRVDNDLIHDHATGSWVPIGGPIANTHVYIFDQQMQPVPIGVTGELYIGGAGIARGYLNRPDLTAARFVPNPFGPGRLYRTGDLARYRADGIIEFLGRLDFQVKVRGFRIELGEIESVLRQHPAVQQAVVVARDDNSGKRLVAYVVGDGADPATLRTYLASYLPDYMLPTAFVLLDTLPLTPSGKLDRRALPAPDTDSLVRAAYTAPRTATEQTLTALWQEVLGLEQVGIHDNFFALGGHSLLAVRLANAIEQSTGQAVAVTILFQHPTIAGLAAQLDSAEQTSDPITRIPISRGEASPTVFPLAHGQQALWFIHQQAPQSAAYNTFMLLRLPDRVDAAALHDALNTLAKRHPVLRTTFTLVAGDPRQVVQPDMVVPLEMLDASGWHDTTVRQQVQARAQIPFDLARGVVRATCIIRGAADGLLLLVIHHIAIDGRTMQIIMRELPQLYQASVQGTAPALPPLAYSYADYVRWEADMLRLEGARLQAYWHQHLAGEVPVLQLPLDFSRPPVQTFNGAAYAFTLDASLTQTVKHLAQRQGVTLFTLLLAAYQVLLHRLTGQNDLLVGTAPEAGRTRPEFADLVGYFVNPIVLRSTIDPDAVPGFDMFLARTNQTVQGALAHQHYPFPLLVQDVLPERDPAYAPLFQTLFLVAQPSGPATVDQWTPSAVLDASDSEGLGQFDLALRIIDTGETLVGFFDYNADLFQATTVERWAGHFETLLHGIVADPFQTVVGLPLLSEAERQQILVDWNTTAAPYPHDQCVPHLIAAQVARTPEAVAVVDANQHLTYHDLHTRANQLAHYLRTLGVTPGTHVALYLDRSLDMLVAVLGVMTAGGAYVPLDPTYPAERLAFMLTDSQAAVVLTHTALRDTLPAHPAQVVCLDTAGALLSQQPTTPPPVAVTPDTPLYLLYTSGSTGTPKGVLLPHRTLVNLTAWQTRQPGLAAPARTLQFAPLSFDVATQEIVTTWATGGTLVLVDAATRRDPVALLADLHQQAIARLFLPFVALQALAEAALGTAALPTCLRDIITAGEQLQITAALRQFFSRLPACRLHNQYGPTETHVVTACTLTGAVDTWPARPPIGRPIPNTQIYILDARQQPVPLGVAGDLYIGGVALARGYHQQPELTAERFIANPFGAGRLYRTGDRAGYQADGQIAFLGRVDSQVKVRGFRIELGEIEHVLSQHPAVQQAVVAVHDDDSGKRLVAYVVGDGADPATLRAHLAAHLPEYMLPAACVQLDALPLTPSGKLDRRALPAPNRESMARAAYEAPRTATEQMLADIWAEVFRLEQVSIHDNFFALGGHSLLIMHLVTRIAAETAKPVSVRDVFLFPTIATLAEKLTADDRKPDFNMPEPSKASITQEPLIHIEEHQTDYLRIEQRSLLSLVLTRQLPSVEAAAFGYLPVALLDHTAASRTEIIHDWYDSMPVVDHIIQTPLGHIAGITLPIFEDELYQQREHLIQLCIHGLHIARHLGAAVVSLTGLIPSATEYGQAIAAACAAYPDLPQISTGHAATAAAVVLNLERILMASGRTMQHERIGILGLGSIGRAALRLLLRQLPHPAELLLCDIYQKAEMLETLSQEIRTVSGFGGTIRIVQSSGQVPAAFYTATTILGATNVHSILDIQQIAPGTIIVDDAAPHCFPVSPAIERLNSQHDILFTEGGVLEGSTAMPSTIFIPRLARQALFLSEQQNSTRFHPHEITGCVLSSILPWRIAHLRPTLGLIDVEACSQYYTALIEAGFRGSVLHCDNYTVPAAAVMHFRQKFGTVQ